MNQCQPVAAGSMPQGTFFLCEEEKDGPLALFASARHVVDPEEFVAVALSGKHAFRLFDGIRARTCVPLSEQTETFLLLSPGSRPPTGNEQLGRLHFSKDKPPFFMASWMAAPGQFGGANAVCIRTWNISGMTTSYASTDSWGLAHADANGHLTDLFNS